MAKATTTNRPQVVVNRDDLDRFNALRRLHGMQHRGMFHQMLECWLRNNRDDAKALSRAKARRRRKP